MMTQKSSSSWLLFLLHLQLFPFLIFSSTSNTKCAKTWALTLEYKNNLIMHYNTIHNYSIILYLTIPFIWYFLVCFNFLSSLPISWNSSSMKRENAHCFVPFLAYQKPMSLLDQFFQFLLWLQDTLQQFIKNYGKKKVITYKPWILYLTSEAAQRGHWYRETEQVWMPGVLLLWELRVQASSFVGSLFIGEFKTSGWTFKAWEENKQVVHMVNYWNQSRSLKQRRLGVRRWPGSSSASGGAGNGFI